MHHQSQRLILQLAGGLLLALGAYLAYTGWNVFFFIVGLAIGFAIPWLDRLFFFSWYQGRTIESIRQYITRSLLFLLAYSAASIFVVTSSNSMLGTGVVLGLGLVLVSELVTMLGSPAQLNMLLGVQKPLKKQELTYLVAGFSAGYVVLVILTFLR